MDLDKARQVAAIGQVMVDSARVEVEFLKATGASAGTGFLEADKQGDKTLPNGITGKTTHRLK